MRSWRRAGKADAAAVEAFLRGREARAAGLIARLLKEGRLRIPSVIGPMGLWIRAGEGGGVEAAALGLAGGLWFAQLPDGEDGAGLAEALVESARLPGLPTARPTSVIGPTSSVLAFETALGIAPAHVVDYVLLERGPWGSLGPGDRRRIARCPIDIRRAGPGDLEELLPLQEAYEREEVAIPIRSFDAASCRAFFARNLSVELIVAARLSEGGRPVGKAGTNARAFTLDQIGGVYVLPEFRGLGVGAELMVALLGLTAKEGRGASLFVKKGNESALALYRGLGFSELDDFRASYHLPR